MVSLRPTLIPRIAQAWAAAAGFRSTEEAMSCPGTSVFMRASMRAQIAADTNGRGESDGG